MLGRFGKGILKHKVTTGVPRLLDGTMVLFTEPSLQRQIFATPSWDAALGPAVASRNGWNWKRIHRLHCFCAGAACFLMLFMNPKISRTLESTRPSALKVLADEDSVGSAVALTLASAAEAPSVAAPWQLCFTWLKAVVLRHPAVSGSYVIRWKWKGEFFMALLVISGLLFFV